MTAATKQQAGTSIVTTPGEREIRIERVFNAPREVVWRAMTEPKLVAEWWGRGNKLDVERLEVAKGGHWRYVEHHDGGSDGFEGRFAEVVRPERMVQTFEWDGMPGYPCRNTATFEDLGDGRTRFVATSLFFTTEERDGMIQSGMEQGMNQSYAHLDTVLDKIK
jgi:uncharacterized protein YndB with AHSA1/START domain